MITIDGKEYELKDDGGGYGCATCAFKDDLAPCGQAAIEHPENTCQVTSGSRWKECSKPTS